MRWAPVAVQSRTAGERSWLLRLLPRLLLPQQPYELAELLSQVAQLLRQSVQPRAEIHGWGIRCLSGVRLGRLAWRPVAGCVRSRRLRGVLRRVLL